MRTSLMSLALGLLASAPLCAQHAPDQIIEITGTVPIGIVKNNQSQTHHWGASRVLQADVAAPFGVLDSADRVYMYSTGVDLTLPSCSRRDQLWLFQNPNTRNGWSTEYSLAQPTRILPKPDASCTGCAPGSTSSNCIGCTAWGDYLYNASWPYRWNGKFYVVVSASPPLNPNPNCLTNDRFFQTLLGVSTDGINWTFRRFLKAPSNAQGLGQSFAGVTWKEIAIQGTNYHWGFSFGKNDITGLRGLGGVRFRHVASPCSNSPWCFPAQGALEVWSSGQWVTVPSCSSIGDTSGYDYCLYTNPGDPVGSRIQIDTITGQGYFPSLHRLQRFANALELWTHELAPAKPNCCQVNNDLGVTILQYQQVFAPTALSQSPQSTLGPRLTLAEGNPAVRCQPGGNAQSRFAPFRLEWTFDMIYSRTTDNSANPFVCPRETHYVVRTLLGIQ